MLCGIYCVAQESFLQLLPSHYSHPIKGKVSLPHLNFNDIKPLSWSPAFAANQ